MVHSFQTTPKEKAKLCFFVVPFVYFSLTLYLQFLHLAHNGKQSCNRESWAVHVCHVIYIHKLCPNFTLSAQIEADFEYILGKLSNQVCIHKTVIMHTKKMLHFWVCHWCTLLPPCNALRKWWDCSQLQTVKFNCSWIGGVRSPKGFRGEFKLCKNI